MADFLYIHIPFCIRKCRYCDFFSIPYNKDLAEEYVNALCGELERRSPSAGELKTVYLGGGTPSLLSEDCVRRLFGCLNTHYRLCAEAEISMEANPGAISLNFLELLVSLGVNRLSLGVQSLVDSELLTLGRIHASADVLDATGAIKAAGIRNWSLDLMYGIPGQTVSTWEETLSKAIGMSPSHFSAYELTPEQHTPLMTQLLQGRLRMPDEDDILLMYDLAVKSLGSSGYRHYEISNYALPGLECRHNLNYWDRGEYIGAGAGAHSFADGLRSSNIREIRKYIALLSEGALPTEESAIVSPADAAKEFIFLGLRKTRGISIVEGNSYGLNLAESSMQLIDEGYLEREGDYLRLTQKGLVVSNTVMVELFEAAGL